MQKRLRFIRGRFVRQRTTGGCSPPSQKTMGISPWMRATGGPSVARRASEGGCFGGFRSSDATRYGGWRFGRRNEGCHGPAYRQAGVMPWSFISSRTAGKLGEPSSDHRSFCRRATSSASGRDANAAGRSSRVSDVLLVRLPWLMIIANMGLRIQKRCG